MDSAANVTLGASGNPGTFASANGLTLNSGGHINGYGAINSPNNVSLPVLNNGIISGTSSAMRLALPGYITGTGTFDNVTFNGTFAPGPSPASVTLGSAQYNGTLEMEIGGHIAGSEYDQLNPPDVIPMVGPGTHTGTIVQPESSTFRLPLRNFEPFLAPDPLDTFVIHLPTLPTQ